VIESGKFTNFYGKLGLQEQVGHKNGHDAHRSHEKGEYQAADLLRTMKEELGI